MAFEISKRAELAKDKIEVLPNIILEIEGLPVIFSSGPVSELLRVGDCWRIGDVGIVIGGLCPRDDVKDYISLSGTTNTITQQLFQDKGGASSITKAVVNLVDINEEITAYFQPEAYIPDPISAKCKLYFGFQDAAHPEDSIKIFDGIISDVSFGAGNVKVAISHPQELARVELLVGYGNELDGAIDNSQTTITVQSTDGLVLPQGGLRTFVRIEDEVIEYTGLTATTITGCIRGSLFTAANPHDDETEVESFYRLEGNPIDLSLQMLLSNGGTPIHTAIEATAFNKLDVVTTIPNAIKFNSDDIQSDLGLVVGDLITITGATNPANNVTNREIVSFGRLASGSYIRVAGNDMVDETSASALADIDSQFNTLPADAGCGIGTDQVDVANFIRIKELFFSTFIDQVFYIRDTIKAKEFIEQEIFFPNAMYSLPRQGRISVGVTNPPIADQETKFIDSNSIINAPKITYKRSINKNMYNAVVYRYEEDVLDEGRYLRKEITLSNDSIARINTKTRPLTIESKGLRRSNEVQGFIQRMTARLLDRYQYGAATVDCKVNYKTGFNMEVGDIVVYGDPDIQMSDDTRGDRQFEQRLMEVVNKKINFRTGETDLKLLTTSFELDGRYAGFSPASNVAATGSTTTRIKIVNSYSTDEFGIEADKWQDYIGQKIILRECDYLAPTEEVTLLEFDASDPTIMIVDPPLTFVPDENWIVEIPHYPTGTDPKENRLYKLLHAFLTPSVAVTTGASNTVFDIDGADVGKFFVGSIVRLNNDDFTDYSPETVVTDITGTTITVQDDLGFTPDSTHVVELVGFPDQGLPYRLI